MTTFLLIRHGSTEYVGQAIPGRLPGVSLDATGRNQAQQLADRLSERDLAAIYSSPLQRAMETAEPLARRRGLQVQIREGVNEVDVGEWQGRSLRDLDADPRWKQFNSLRSVKPAIGGELMLEIQARIVREFDELRRLHPGQSIAVFSHGDVIKAAVMICLGIPLDYHQRLEIDPATVSVIEFADWGPKVTLVNG